jgi:hypothetical protein
MHHAQPFQTTDEESGLLPKLPTGGRFRPLTLPDVTSGELPEAGEESRRGPTLNEPPSAAPQDDHRGAHVGSTRTP